MRTTKLGSATVSVIGLGGMPMSIEGRPDEDRSVRTIHAALAAGVTLIDTADAYHLKAGETGHNERLIAKALASYGGDTSNVLVATKGGHIRPGDGSWTVDGSPEHLREAAEASLKALGVDAIGLYQFHRTDPDTPYEDSIGALKELLDAGKIRLAGISNASVEQIDTARRILGEGNLAPWAGSAGPGSWASGTARSVRSPMRMACHRSRWRWPGSWPRRRWSSPSRAPAGRSQSLTRSRRPTWC
jgi:aryl-alcohol dehydrogenase-like predicted oxidoreductase